MSLIGVVDSIDSHMDKIQRKVTASAAKDPALTVVVDMLASLEKSLNKAQGSAEELHDNAKKALRR